MQAKTISFCVTCRDRRWQIEKTLAENLSVLAQDTEIVLVDYGSTDDLSGWVWREFRRFIEAQKLIFFEVAGQPAWHSSRAKNLAHRLASGTYVFSLDADNFITPGDANLIRAAADRGTPTHQWSGDPSDGSHGRIGLPRALFMRLGGYDEGMLPMGWQDVDLILRIRSVGADVVRLQSPERAAVQNAVSDKVYAVSHGVEDPSVLYQQMLRVNARLSRLRLKLEGAERRGGFASFRGRLNGVDVVIDGFNRIQRLRTGVHRAHR